VLQELQRGARGIAHLDGAIRPAQQFREQVAFVRLVVHDEHAIRSFFPGVVHVSLAHMR
jgi:hypothetical protein